MADGSVEERTWCEVWLKRWRIFAVVFLRSNKAY